MAGSLSRTRPLRVGEPFQFGNLCPAIRDTLHAPSSGSRVDSAHEEQALRLHELDPPGPAPDEIMARLGWYIKPGQRLDWHTDVPLVVIGRGTPFERTARDGSNSQTNRMTEEQFTAWDRIWTEFQKDLAKRSRRGQYRVAQKSGHWIQRDQPELVVGAIRDVCRMAGTP